MQRSIKLYMYKTSIAGVAAVEFAVIAPVMVLMLTGIMAYGVFFGAANSIQHLAASAARVAMGGLDMDERQQLVDDYVRTFLMRDGMLNDEHLTVELIHPEGEESLIAVAVSYDASELPVWNLYSGLPLPEQVIRRESVIRTGGY